MVPFEQQRWKACFQNNQKSPVISMLRAIRKYFSNAQIYLVKSKIIIEYIKISVFISACI